jgi:S-formylglutathione hydrolase FrmB
MNPRNCFVRSLRRFFTFVPVIRTGLLPSPWPKLRDVRPNRAGGTLVKHAGWMAVVLLAAVGWSPASAHPVRRFFELGRVNRQIAGHVLDYTRNHGADRRIWSPALQQYRDMYVYLPPGFDPCKQYPLLLWLHGYAQDEYSFLGDVIVRLDMAIRNGLLPPAIIAAPDGSIRGIDCFLSAGSFFLNSEAGRFEDYLMVDVWNFLMSHFPIRPEPEAHVILGVSLGAGAAFNKAIKFPGYFRTVVGVFPPLNLRWQDCHGRYRGAFDPNCWGWRTDFDHRRREVIARFYGIPIRLRAIIRPLYGRRNPETLPALIHNNPIEMLDIYDVQPGDLNMYVAYGGRDQFNIDAQVESFLFVAHLRGLEVGVGYDPDGKHDRPTAKRLMPGIVKWLAPRLAPYAPDAGAVPERGASAP